MKHFIKLGVLGLTLSMGLSACTYQNPDEILKVNDKQKTIGLVLGDTHRSTIYNVKTPQDVYLYAPAGYKILLGKEKQEYFKQHINPQESINLRFKILKDGDDIKNYQEVDKLVMTYKEDVHPKYQQDILHEGGKSHYREGDTNYFKVAPTQKDIVIELHEYNQDEIHAFNYSGVQNDLRIKLIAPKYNSFVFNGRTVKEYEFNMKKDTNTAFTMKLKADWTDKNDTYSREYRFKLKK